MPTYPVPKASLPHWADPERGSVFDTLPEKMARKAVSAGREITKLLGADPEDPVASVMGAAMPGAAVVANTARRIAPKKAIKELVDLLRGESKRLGDYVPPAYRDISDADASLTALLSSRHGGVPPKPVRLRLSTPILQGDAGITRDPAVNEAFKTYTKLHPGARARDFVYVKQPTESAPLPPRPIVDPYKQKIADAPKAPTGTHDLVKGRSIKVLTAKEMINMLEGPRKAVAAGIFSKEEAANIIKRNSQLIDDYLARLRELDLERYRDMMNKRLAISDMNRGGK